MGRLSRNQDTQATKLSWRFAKAKRVVAGSLDPIEVYGFVHPGMTVEQSCAAHVEEAAACLHDVKWRLKERQKNRDDDQCRVVASARSILPQSARADGGPEHGGMVRSLERERHLQAVVVSGLAIVIAATNLQLVDEVFERLEHCGNGKLFEINLLDRSAQGACALAGLGQQAADISSSKTVFEGTIFDIEIGQINFIMGHNAISCKFITILVLGAIAFGRGALFATFELAHVFAA
ncbi:hypothetical protein [Methylobacterium sp. ID0610]|uniref:hypothetical protein n=1 Tax=Methylobacterium carpenticola TaxID=3344827 RepID=UPI0036A6D223